MVFSGKRKKWLEAIRCAEEAMEREISRAVGLEYIPSPMFVRDMSGVNDDLNGEEPVRFQTSDGEWCSVVHSLAKWKRWMLWKLRDDGVSGIWCDMRGIRKCEDADVICTSRMHSYQVEQFDWEKVIPSEKRNIEFLKETVREIYRGLKAAKERVDAEYPGMFLRNKLADEVRFVQSQELEELFPELNAQERENAIAREAGSVFIIGIGHPLKSGKEHGQRSADYDDWDLNGDLIVWNEVIGCGMEVSSMGIRVDHTSLKRQLEAKNESHKAKYEFHRGVLEGVIPPTIGGGIGKSRVVMFLLEARHIGEIQASVWPKKVHEECADEGIHLL